MSDLELMHIIQKSETVLTVTNNWREPYGPVCPTALEYSAPAGPLPDAWRKYLAAAGSDLHRVSDLKLAVSSVLMVNPKDGSLVIAPLSQFELSSINIPTEIVT